ncbi:4-hydroxy-tetrahydrodipicolinate reductase [Spirochaeta isovalerica]|uniref:4-hydroxy-tetrahydrodipicolinate reductase n=1 Tax=Spirochaeta isovalerica TaxID=150 RepID=A0A841R9P0_9SPIO|nr:4-hydroxy-tetrahydrodipicolinate reductase [Spirochaeta isovalerica]MBB6480625.1 4-hydroxy-tetrahydrodipicolinate reductase [Spirochaeta isovalerica]
MNIVINGYGRMGHQIEEILLERGDTVSARIDISGRSDYPDLTGAILNELKPDAVIEFATEDCVVKHAEICSKAGVPLVVGTTGWSDRVGKVKEIIESNNSAYLYGSNFSVGAHMFFALVEKAAAMINPLPEYDIFMTEFHHNKKVDSPSGTALTTAHKIIENNNRKTEIVIDPLQRKIEENELHVASVRGGSVPGTHSVYMDSLADTIEITHRARSRKGFAMGSVLAAQWLMGKKGFFTIEDYIKDLLGQ